MSTIDRAAAGGTVLDFGAGRGAVTELLCRSGRFERVIAVDLIRYPGAEPRADWRQADLNGPVPCDAETVDAVVAVGVVEYLENLHHVAREWFRVLRPGGLVVGTTPNNESWRAVASYLVRGQFAAFGNPRYQAPLTPVTRWALRRALGDAGFGEPGFFWGEGALPKLTGLTWQRISAGALRGLRYSDTLGWVAEKPS